MTARASYTGTISASDVADYIRGRAEDDDVDPTDYSDDDIYELLLEYIGEDPTAIDWDDYDIDFATEDQSESETETTDHNCDYDWSPDDRTSSIESIRDCL